jgi:Ca-activated chloride channel family protein
MKALSWLLVCALSASASAGTTEGRLVARDKGKSIDVPLEHTDVKIRVDGFLADATVTQKFHNPYATKIEAVYLFPLPTGAAVTDMTITTGGHVIRGSIQERAHATKVYEAAREKGFVAALLTEERPNLFTQNIANLESNASIEVTLHYTERLKYEDGGYELVFPMVAAPRPGAVAVQALPPGTRSSHDISLEVELDAGVPIEGVRSPSHVLAIARPDAARAQVQIDAGDTIPNKDFVLRYDVAGRAAQLGAFAYKDGNTGSFLLLAQPPAEKAPVAIAPREIVFVLDTSSSMRGAPLAKAKELIRHVMSTMRADDTFQIVRFDDRASALGPAPIANKPKNVQLVLDWLAALDAAGTTEMTTGIDAALAVPHDPARLRIVAFLTDGYVGNEDEILKKVGDHAGESRLYAFGVGSAVNRYLLEEMAALGRGTAQFVRPDEDTAAVVRAFESRIDAPVVTDVKIDWGGLAVTDVTPSAVPDLFLGQPLVVAGHYAKAGSGMVTVHGRQAGRDISFQVAVSLPEHDATRPAIATVWARARIAELERQLVRKNDPAVEKDILGLSLANHLLTRFTAFVAVDESQQTAGAAGKRVVVPVEVPSAVAGIGAAGGGYGAMGYGVSGVGYGGGGTAWGAIGTGTYMTIGHGAGTSGGFGGGFGVGGAMGGMRARTAAVPSIVLAQPTVQGDLDKAIIRRYIKRSIQKLSYCYEKELLGHPKLAGTIDTKFVIDENGRVASSEASGVDPTVSSCVAAVIKDIEFPKAVGGGRVVVNYPFTFKPAEETKP